LRPTGYNARMTNPLTEALALHAARDDVDCVPIDCRFDLLQPEAGRRAYGQGHVPGARYAHLDADLSIRPGAGQGRHPLPSPESFARRLGEWGVSNDSWVVAYDEGNGAFAARLWWMLRWLGHEKVSVLNGGMTAWRALGLALETETPQWRPCSFRIDRVREDWIVGADRIPEILSAGGVLLDARAERRFQGREEPIDRVAGHIPGAENRPFTENLLPDGRFKQPETLRAEFEGLLAGHRPQSLVAMCGSGVTACHLLLAMRVAGLADGRLYAGSWSGWITDPERPIAAEEGTRGSESG
jgi:thiosulfate/3-mercaptopyruvate sulfurtransferase